MRVPFFHLLYLVKQILLYIVVYCYLQVRANALIKCASLYIQTDEEEKCFANFKLAEQIDPQNSDIYHHRGQVTVCVCV